MVVYYPVFSEYRDTAAKNKRDFVFRENSLSELRSTRITKRKKRIHVYSTDLTLAYNITIFA